MLTDLDIVFNPPMYPIDNRHKWLLYFKNESDNEPIIVKEIQCFLSGGLFENMHKRSAYLTMSKDVKVEAELANSIPIKSDYKPQIAVSWDGVGMGLILENTDEFNASLSYPMVPGPNKIKPYLKLMPGEEIFFGAYADLHDMELGVIIKCKAMIEGEYYAGIKKQE